MSLYLLDTCTVSDFFRDSGSTQKKMRAVAPAQIVISSITVMEVLYGFELNLAIAKKFSASFQALRSVTRTLPFGSKEAESAAVLRAELKTKGTPIGGWDLLIGATALANNCILVTSNLGEFQRINGLIVESWR